MWFFIGCFIVGSILPLIFVKAKNKFLKWIPAIILLIGSLLMIIKAYFFPEEGMAELGDMIVFMMLGSAAIGSLVGIIFVKLIKKD